jgi:hypothetical protein
MAAFETGLRGGRPDQMNFEERVAGRLPRPGYRSGWLLKNQQIKSGSAEATPAAIRCNQGARGVGDRLCFDLSAVTKSLSSDVDRHN